MPPNIVSKFLDDSSESILSIVCHCVRLVQNDELVTPRNIDNHSAVNFSIISLVEDGPGGSEIEDLASHNSDATVVTCVQLQHLLR